MQGDMHWCVHVTEVEGMTGAVIGCTAQILVKWLCSKGKQCNHPALIQPLPGSISWERQSKVGKHMH